MRASAVVVCSLLLYGGAVSTPDEAINMFTTRRCQPPQMQPSELRVVGYMAQLMSGKLPHMKPLIFKSLLVQPVPVFTRARDGCRPYAEIYSNGAMVSLKILFNYVKILSFRITKKSRKMYCLFFTFVFYKLILQHCESIVEIFISSVAVATCLFAHSTLYNSTLNNIHVRSKCNYCFSFSAW